MWRAESSIWETQRCRDKPLPSACVSSRKVGKSDPIPAGQSGQVHPRLLPFSSSEMISSPPENSGSILHLLLIYFKSALSAKSLRIYSPTVCLWFLLLTLFDCLFLQATLVAHTVTPPKINSKHYPKFSPKFHLTISCSSQWAVALNSLDSWSQERSHDDCTPNLHLPVLEYYSC